MGRMRRSLAAALLGISLWIGSLAWSGFVMTRTVLDPGRSEDVADALLEDDAVRAQLEANIAGGVRAALPDGAPVDPATIDAGAEAALASPAVEALVRDALVRTHQAFLGEGDSPDSIVLPEASSVEVPLPTERVPNLGPVRRWLVDTVPLLAAVAAIGAALALVLTTDRPRVLRRAGVWAIGLSTLVLAVAFGVPALAQQVAPGQATILAALVSALAKSTRWPALTLAGAGIAGVLASYLWRPVAAATVPAEPPPTAGPVPAPRRSPRRDLPRPARRPSVPPTATPRPPAHGGSTLVVPMASEDAPTRVVTAGEGRPREGARWVAGVGWVHEGQGPIPRAARWVPGVGYVLDDS